MIRFILTTFAVIPHLSVHIVTVILEVVTQFDNLSFWFNMELLIAMVSLTAARIGIVMLHACMLAVLFVTMHVLLINAFFLLPIALTVVVVVRQILCPEDFRYHILVNSCTTVRVNRIILI